MAQQREADRQAAQRQKAQRQAEQMRRNDPGQQYTTTTTNTPSHAVEHDSEPMPWQFWVFGLFGAFYVGVLSNAYGYHWLLGSTVGFLGLGIAAAWLKESPVGRKILWLIAILAVGTLAIALAVT